jgi:hypothetical protein
MDTNDKGYWKTNIVFSPSLDQVGGNHYKNLPIQPIHYSERNKLTPMEHTAIKYITRHRFKGGKQDIEKAIHTLNLILEEYYPEPNVKLENCTAVKRGN